MTRICRSERLCCGQQLQVKGNDCHYLLHVRRHRVGDDILLQDGAGTVFSAIIETTERHLVTLSVTNRLTQSPGSAAVRMVMAIPKGSLMDEVIRRLSELGVDRLSPVDCERSILNPGTGRQERWLRIAEAAMQQCGRNTPLEINPVVPLSTIWTTLGEGERVLFHPMADTGVSEWVTTSSETAITALVGPEGGFTATEVEAGEAVGCQAVHLGPRILRVETAAVVSAVLCVSRVGGFDR